MKCIADSGVLLALLCEGHRFQASAYEWFGGREAASVGWRLTVRLEVLRRLSSSRFMGSGVLSPLESLAAWQKLARDERMFEITSLPMGIEERFRANVSACEPSPKLWGDAWLAALAETLGCEIVSYDAGFRRFGLTCLTVLDGAV